MCLCFFRYLLVWWAKILTHTDRYSLAVILGLCFLILVLFSLAIVAFDDVCKLSACDDDMYTEVEVRWQNATGSGTKIITVPKIQTRRLLHLY